MVTVLGHWALGIEHWALGIVLVLVSSPAAAFDYAQERAKAVRTCEAIDPSASQSGLLLNPDGYRSFYERSRCLQDAAVQFRDATLCAQVRQRRSLFSSSWGYSPDRCRQLVSDGIARDRAELDTLRRAYLAGGVRFRDVQIERNGNGRDFDIIPAFTGTYGHGHTLTFEIVGGAGVAAPVLVHTSGYWVDGTSNLRLYVRQSEIRGRFPAFALNQPYTVRATIVLDVGFGGQAGYWSDAFIERVFPRRERSHSITFRAAF